MTRHSKNQNERPFFSHSERSKVGFGHSREVIDADSKGRFGHCCLTLKPCDIPVATADGYIYDKDSLIEYMAKEKEKLSSVADKVCEDHAFSTERNASAAHPNPRVDAALGTSFWISPPNERKPAVNPHKHDTHVKCPMSGNRLRLKELCSIKLESSCTSAVEYVCSVSKRVITHQKAVLLKPSGLVVLESVYLEVIKPSGRCPITGMTLKPEDVLPLQRSGTTFAHSGKNEVKRDIAIKSRAFEGGTRGLRI